MNSGSRTRNRLWGLFGGLVTGNCLIILTLLLLVTNDGTNQRLTPNEITSTSVVATNHALEQQYYATLTSLALIDQATRTQIWIEEMTATADQQARD